MKNKSYLVAGFIILVAGVIAFISINHIENKPVVIPPIHNPIEVFPSNKCNGFLPCKG